MNIVYEPGFIATPAPVFEDLWTQIDWERRGSTPRREYYCSDAAVDYVYGRGAGVRTYRPRAWHPTIRVIKDAVEDRLGVRLDVAFLNGYEDGSDFLGWHADDSDTMDDARPIAIVSVGAEREIWLRANAAPMDVHKLRLASGSLCVMPAGMQDSHMHRIPKSGSVCGPRVSITLRGYVAPTAAAASAEAVRLTDREPMAA